MCSLHETKTRSQLVYAYYWPLLDHQLTVIRHSKSEGTHGCDVISPLFTSLGLAGVPVIVPQT